MTEGKILVVTAYHSHCEGDVDHTIVAASSEIAQEVAAGLRKTQPLVWKESVVHDFEKPETVARWWGGIAGVYVFGDPGLGLAADYWVTIKLLPFVTS